MVFFEKSQPAPECLAKEKLKATGDYKRGEVMPILQKYFRNKCYLCEAKGVQTINVEHFIPHKTDIDLKFDWNNLFWSCGHCNNIKLGRFIGILNCTQDVNIEHKIQYIFKPFPLEKPRLIPIDKNSETVLTCELLEAIYNGSTLLKKIEAANLRDNLLEEIMDFQKELKDYFIRFRDNPQLREKAESNIQFHLSKSSAFTAFKRQIIRDNEEMNSIFEKHFD